MISMQMNKRLGNNQNNSNNTNRQGIIDRNIQKIHEKSRKDGIQNSNEVEIEVENLADLETTNLSDILNTLEKRYLNNKFYTEASITLIALNPFRNIDHLYSKKVIEFYNANNNSNGNSHLFKYAAVTWNNLKSYLETEKKQDCLINQDCYESQAVIVSGESGAGKTQTISYIIDYFTQIINNKQTDSIENLLLLSNIILEAFGNAHTQYNHNSSRFCKFIQLNFLDLTSIHEANLNTYLLEKTRVTQENNEFERNFHIFYQMVYGTNEKQKKEFHLNEDIVSDFSVTNDSQFKNDIKKWNLLQSAFTKLNFTNTDRIYELLSAILHLNSCRFHQNDVNDRVRLDDTTRARIECASKILGFNTDDFENSLIIQELNIKNNKVTKYCTLNEVINRKSSIAMLIYSQLFEHLVDELNKKLKPNNTDFVGYSKKIGKISLLDIYGFENLVENSLEQLCINYANERLQQVYTEYFFKERLEKLGCITDFKLMYAVGKNSDSRLSDSHRIRSLVVFRTINDLSYVFKLTKEIYLTENITWSYNNFKDNLNLINLIEINLLTVLNEECLLKRQLTTENLSNKLFNQLKDKNLIKSPATSFTIKHYAGDVTYTCRNLIEKNKDHISLDLIHTLSDTQNRFLLDILKNFLGKKLNSNKFTSVLSKFKLNLDDLIGKLKENKILFIRCIKPNRKFQSTQFDRTYVKSQLESCGIIDIIKLNSIIFTHLTKYETFLEHYMPILKIHASRRENDRIHRIIKYKTDRIDDLKAFIVVLLRLCLNKSNIPKSSYEFGKTKLFYKTDVAEILNAKLTETKQKAALRIQHAWRLYVSRSISISLTNENKPMIRYYNDIYRFEWDSILQLLKTNGVTSIRKKPTAVSSPSSMSFDNDDEICCCFSNDCEYDTNTELFYIRNNSTIFSKRDIMFEASLTSSLN